MPLKTKPAKKSRNTPSDKLFYFNQCCGSGSAWIRNFCLDLDPDPELLFRIHQNMKEQINKIFISL